jgi:hypothetical protein
MRVVVAASKVVRPLHLLDPSVVSRDLPHGVAALLTRLWLVGAPPGALRLATADQTPALANDRDRCRPPAAAR